MPITPGGEAINGRGGRAPGFPLYFNAAEYKNTLQRVRDIPVKTLAQAHRYRWSGASQEAIRTGDEVRQTLDDSMAVWQSIDDAVRAELQVEPKLAFPDLVRRVIRRAAPALGNDPAADVPPAGSVATIAAHARAARRTYV